MVIARCPLVFTGGHRGGVATGLLGWLAVDAYFAFTGRSGDGVLDALRQRRTVATPGHQFMARSAGLRHRRLHRAGAGPDKRPVALGGAAAGYLDSDAAQRPASGVDSVGYFTPKMVQVDALYPGEMGFMQAGIKEGDTKAITTAIRVSERRCRLLGLDMPERHEVKIDAETQALADQVVGALQELANLPTVDDEDA